VAADHNVRNLLNGSTLILYNGTADTATTFTLNGESNYLTNRTYVNFLGTTVTPKATNSVTGGLVPAAVVAAPVFALSTGAVSDNHSVTINWGITSELTNYATIRLQKSVDGGLTYDDNPT